MNKGLVLMLIMVSAMLLLLTSCGDDSAADKFAKLDSQQQQANPAIQVTETPTGANTVDPAESAGNADSPVCGDGVCEGNETEERCEDCPTCNDFNRCTRDYFDLTAKACKHERRMPCCGDGECLPSEANLCIDDCGSDILLDDFPKPFITNDKWNMILVIGKQGTSAEVVAATSITEGLVYSDVAQGYSKYAKLDSEVESIEGKNVILIGNPCTNTYVEQLMPFTYNCIEEFKKGEGLLKLFKTGSDSYALVVAGYSGDDIRRAAEILGNYRSAGLQGYQRKV